MDENVDGVGDKFSKLKAELSELSFVDLRAIEAWLGNEIDKRQVRELESFIKRVQQEALRAGFGLEQVLDQLKPSHPVRKKVNKGKGVEKAAAKYQHPDEPIHVWSGRGRPPKWYQQLKEDGREPVEVMP